jgi:DUF1009 family protein
MALRPDLGLVRLLPEALRFIRAGGDDALLSQIIRLFESQGLHVSGVADVAPELLIGAGRLGRRDMSAATRCDEAIGSAVIDALGDFDVGQGVVVANGEVIAIEGVEGTDRMLGRVAALRREAPAACGVLVKRPKPRQERRVDLPTIGPRTVEGAHAAGLAGISVDAASTVVLDREQTARASDELGLFVAGVAPVGRSGYDVGSRAEPDMRSARLLSRRRPSMADAADVEIGAAAVARLAPFRAGRAAAVVRSHVLAVAGGETALDLAERLGDLRQWGSHRLKRRRGALTIRYTQGEADALDAERLAAAMTSSGLGGVGFVASGSADLPSRLIRQLDGAGLFVLDLRAAVVA